MALQKYHLYDANGAVANEIIVAAARVSANQNVRVKRIIVTGPTGDWVVFEDTGGTEVRRFYLGAGALLDLETAPGEDTLIPVSAGLGLQWDFASATAVALDVHYDIF